MRLLPVSSEGTLRMSTRDHTFGQHTIPAGVVMWMPFMSFFNHPQQWEDPDSYRPVSVQRCCATCRSSDGKDVHVSAFVSLQDRWLSPDAENARFINDDNTMSDLTIQQGSVSAAKRFFPFSLGSRNCIGRGLAQMNYTVTVAKLLARFSFRLADEVGCCLADGRLLACHKSMRE